MKSSIGRKQGGVQWTSHARRDAMTCSQFIIITFRLRAQLLLACCERPAARRVKTRERMARVTTPRPTHRAAPATRSEVGARERQQCSTRAACAQLGAARRVAITTADVRAPRVFNAHDQLCTCMHMHRFTCESSHMCKCLLIYHICAHT